MKKLFLLGICCAYCQMLFAQNIDSLINIEQHYLRQDTTKLKMMANIALMYVQKNKAAGEPYIDKAISLATKLNDAIIAGDLHRYKSSYLYRKSDFLNAIKEIEIALGFFKKSNVPWKMGYAYLAIGDNYRMLSLFPQAIDNILKAMKNFELAKFDYGIGISYRNLGLIYMDMREYDKALEQYKKETAIDAKLANKEWISLNYLNVGDAYMHLKENEKALEYNKKALDIMTEIRDQDNMVNTLFNLATITTRMGQKKTSEHYLEMALKTSEDRKSSSALAATYSNLGYLYNDLTAIEQKEFKITPVQQYRKALNFFQKAKQAGGAKINIINSHYIMASFYENIPDTILTSLQLDEKTRSAIQLNNINLGLETAKNAHMLAQEQLGYDMLSKYYEAHHDFNNAYEAYKNFILIRDSISNVANQKKITTRELQFEFDKKESQYALEKSLTNEKLQKQELLNQQQHQTLLINQNKLALNEKELQIANKDKELQRLNYLKTQADLNNAESRRREDAKQLTISRQKQELQKSQIGLQLSEIKAGSLQRNLFIAASFFYWYFPFSYFVITKIKNWPMENCWCSMKK